MSFPNSNSGSSTGGFSFSAPGGTQSQSGDGKPVSLFGGGSSGSAPAFGASSGTASSGLFGSKPAASGTSGSQAPGTTTGLFGNTAAPSSGGLFGSANKPASGGLFGSSAASTAPATTPAAGESGFTFGKTDSAAKPFSLGPASTEKKDQAPAAFSFGAKPDDKKDQAAPSLFGASSAQSDNKPAFSFGASSGASSTQEQSKPLFGAKPEENKDKPAFSFGTKPEEKKDTPGFSFGAKPEEKKDTPGFSFGAKPEEKKDQPGFSFGAKPEEKKDQPGFSFGAKPEEKKDQPGFSLGAKPEDKKDDKPAFSLGSTQKEDDKPAFSFGSKPEEQKSALTDKNNATTSAAGSAGVVDPAKAEISPSVYLKNKSFEDVVAKWTSALSKSTTRFKSQAEIIAEWDRILADNGAKISEVYNEVVAAEQTQTRIDDLLNYLGRQQDDMEAMLDKYERQANEILPEGSADRLQPVDRERSEAYALAQQVNTKLDSLETQLVTVIDEINKVTKDANQLKEEDPLAQIVQILNSHVASLDWIDENASKLQEKLGKAYSQSSRLQF
ncbi:Nucleoporin NSP1 [Wickerhamiella sorbophila]|uniref:Nucleoporin NSP1 n=1 Tax=Wickerhamiella sorbophila TaxID=45607 RepID=A0A2T0FHK3_9ASCO|nr:Nucleoporin NSP1 [Wickerhamiella sorbophila]PRT54456.1 Nucleoporin NSP1 [Wickerhamiella sorbophila]